MSSSTVLHQALELGDRALWRATTATTRFGERHHIDWLTYSPLQLIAYHRLAVIDAPSLADAIIATVPEARRWVDVGAGSGALARAAKDRGIEVTALERALGGRAIARLNGVNVHRVDIEDATTVGGPYDLALSIEVAEHLPAELGRKLVAMLVASAPTVVFSAARPGQGGLGHINEQPVSYWRDRFAEVGWDRDDARTEALATHLGEAALHADWLAGNVQVFAS